MNTKSGEQSGGPNVEPTDGYRFIGQELWVDFLGGLLPGTLFLAGALGSLFPTVYLLVKLLDGAVIVSFIPLISGFLKLSVGTPNMLWVFLATIFLSFAYVIGFMFLRQDPKEPDQHSWAFLRDNFQSEIPGVANKPKRWFAFEVVEILMRKISMAARLISPTILLKWLAADAAVSEESKEELRKEFGCGTRDECQFPYDYIDSYLVGRGLDHLLCFTKPWTGLNSQGKSNRGKRTKNYVNILKVRLKYWFPKGCAAIVRNEAHVRLGTSAWFAAGGLIVCGIISLVILISAFPFAIFAHGPELLISIISSFSVPVITTLLVLLSGLYVRTRVREFMHYQRMREIIFVLETAWTAFFHSPQLLNPPFVDYYEKVVALSLVPNNNDTPQSDETDP